ncbi:signal recognition particle-docking protein FtsY [Chromobacterium violaceum]|uniref:signal recognition particle-docking protein FtsY n=1 Tax=Chromobacterium violaceum TaxID=536 RepID=UPI0005B8A71E|nr:signal recognition particle-docking protein FtsY [Chromobacterium violaceum]ATP30386.1 signal recognition particle-docking protein FtsY [Chromobacterium violaceum]ATP34294.1 signal recognition particle-docking protein FtsY [Chromobacterium violaceum]OQS50445.1 signal recognition particle-docking protein FtsY [Chromobacterium violaceum]OQS52630.1 signal recognition particle-docking protein FtsY [Chromobacterium violaceum]QIY79750.1 signal recognition particle-docking protein FtsY [Chromobact
MFSFFKKKTKPAETPQIETPAPLAPEQAPAAPETIAPVPEPQREPVAAPIAETAPASAEAAVAAIPDEPVPLKKMSWTERLKAGLAKTRDKLGKQLAGLFGGGKIDEDLYEELETVLLTADMGMDATVHLLQDVRERVSLKGLKDSSELKGALKDSLQDLIGPLEVPLNVEGKKPFVIMMTGVNGAGKTTSIGKLAKYYQSQGKSVLLAAGDTFRAAAREQLIAWGERNNVTVIAQQGGDSAAVCYDAIQAAIARGIDIVLADTAGRLPTQLHLMEEIKKVKRVIQKALPDAPHEVVLVLDANIGQNTVNQVKAFDDALGLTGLILTKLDGTAKGGVIAAIAKQRPIPLRFVGVGESIDDLRPFDSRDYIDALFE